MTETNSAHLQHDGPVAALVKNLPPRDRWLPESGVVDLIGFKRTWIKQAILHKGFPQPYRFSARCVRFSERAVLTWMEKHAELLASKEGK